MNYTVEFENTTEAAAESTAATIDLRTGEETIEVLNQTVSASGLVVDGKSISSSPTDQDICDIYTSTIEGCPDNYECNIENSLPTCQRIQEPNNLPLIIGIGIGVPICLLLLVLAATLIWQANKHSAEKKKVVRHERHKTERSFEHAQQSFPSMAPYNAMIGWREKPVDILVPFEYSSSRASDDTQSRHKHYKKSKRYDSLYDRNVGSYIYDNKGAEFDDFTNDSHDKDRHVHKQGRHARY